MYLFLFVIIFTYINIQKQKKNERNGIYGKLNLKIKNNKRGITLIGLVVTIVILLILAGISIATLTGNSGIIKKANKAKKETEISSLKEQISLAISQAEAKHLNATLEHVIEELINEEIILDANSVNKITGVITTKKPQYNIEGMLDNYLDTENIDETDIFLETVKDKNNITQEELEEFNKTLEDGKKIILIKTFEDLDKIGKDQNYPLNAFYIQVKDITFTETNILNPIESFTGIYNGNSKIIYNLHLNINNSNVGIFAENQGKLKNITVSNYNIISEYSYIGTIVGNNEGVIVNCIVKEGNVSTPRDSSEDGNCIGGICGMNQNGGTIKQCTNYSTVYGNQKLIGGICGYSLGGNIENCYNYGNIEGNAQVGGIAGDSQGIDENSVIYLKNCKNFGNIKGIKNEESRYDYASIGGIVGCNYRYSILQDNINQGKVESNEESQGGISGINYYIIIRCSNIGEIINTKKDGNAIVGGITGYNLGKITINSTNDTFGGAFGGIDTVMDVTNIKNIYYLDTTCNKGYGNENIIGNIEGVTKKTSEEITNLFSLLGNEFKQNTEGDRYPKLKWE